MTLCSAVTKRAGDGPCAVCVVVVHMSPEGTWAHQGHDWLGLPVERCGHEKHGEFCVPCYDQRKPLAGPNGERGAHGEWARHPYEPGMKCPSCTGGLVGYHEESDEYETCKPCNGTGIVPVEED